MIYDSKLDQTGEISDSGVVVMPAIFVSGIEGDIREVDESLKPKQEHCTTIGIPQ